MRATMIPPAPPASTLRTACLVLWGVPALLLIDTGYAAALRGWRPAGTVETVILAGLAIWLGTAVALLSRGVRWRLAGHWRELLLLAITTGVCVLLLELSANHLERGLRPHAPFHTRGVNIRNTFTPHPEWLPGIEGPSRFTTGPDGVRAPAPPAGAPRRVLCIGGSTTECVYLDDTETWAALLPAKAGIPDLWSGNVGISGFDSRDHLQFVQRSRLLDGISALIVQPGINDMWRYLAGEVERMDYGRFAGEAPPGAAPAPARLPYRPWWTRSRAVQLYHTWRQPPPPPEEREGVGGEEYRIRREKRAAATLTDALPDLVPGLYTYRRHVEAMIDGCRARGVAVIFTTQPVLWRDGLPAEVAARCWFGWLPDGRYLSIGALRDAMDHYNAALMEVCASAGVPCVDLSSLNGDPNLFYDDCHFTEVGADRVAALVGPVLGQLIRPQP